MPLGEVAGDELADEIKAPPADSPWGGESADYETLLQRCGTLSHGRGR